MADGIDIRGIDKAELTAALYNRSKPLAFGFIEASPQDMTVDEARKIIDGQNGDASFHYLQGRVMKVDLNGHTFSPGGFDKDNGAGAAQSVVEAIRTGASTPKNPADFEDGRDEFLKQVRKLARQPQAQ